MAKAELITPYQPDLDKIAQHSLDPTPKILSRQAYFNWLEQMELRTGRMSDEGILKAMESGLIKISDPDNTFDLLSQIQPSSVDLRLGRQFWYFGQQEISRLTMGKHREILQSLDMLKYGYRPIGGEIVFHTHRFLLALTEERITLSNVIQGDFDGRSSAARLGLANHQTAGGIEPSFSGHIVMELSNQNELDIAVPVLARIATIRFEFLASPTTRIRSTQNPSASYADNQISPFGFWNEDWTRSQEAAMRKFLDQSNGL